MQNTVLHELHFGDHPVTILRNEEGDIYPAYELPYPTGEEADKIEAYLAAEGFLGKPPEAEKEPPQVLTPGMVVRYKTGTNEFYSNEHADLVTYDKEAGCAVLLFGGKAIELTDIVSLEQEEA